MAETIIISIAGVLAGLAIIYLIVGIIIAKRIVKPSVRSEEMVFKEEHVDQSVSVDVLDTPHTRVEIMGRNRYKLSARVYLAKNGSNKWILALHGYTNRSLTIAKYAVIFNKLGYNVLAPDMRACGLSGGKSVTFGHFERRDSEDWIEYLRKTYSNIQIGIFGISLGAATGIIVASLRSDIEFLISYCSYSSFKNIIKARGPDYFKQIMLLYPAIIFGAYILTRAPLYSIDISEAIKFLDCKTLILHSKGDAFTPYAQALELSSNNPLAKLYLFEKGAHARAYATSPLEYEKVVTEFLQDANK